MIFLSISSFREKIKDLLKIRKGVYAGVTDEIIHQFKGQNIQQIRQNQDIVLLEEEMIVIKLRLPDKKHHLSKSNGFRLIYIVSKVRELVVFLYIYPKNGPLQQLSISDNELKALISTFILEAEQGSLETFPINN